MPKSPPPKYEYLITDMENGHMKIIARFMAVTGQAARERLFALQKTNHGAIIWLRAENLERK